MEGSESSLPFFLWNSSQQQQAFAKGMTAASVVLPLENSQTLVNISQPEFISHIVMLVFRVRPRSLHFCSAERGVSMVVEGWFAVGIGASLDVDGRIARTGNMVTVEAAFQLAFAKGRDGGGGGIVD